jgi:SAM-dependent methyltransferase
VSDLQLNYTGLDVLETLDSATNYNALLLDLVLRSAGGRRRMLDFGAGLGTFSKLLRNKDVQVVCVEPDAYLSEILARDGFTTFRDLNEVPDDSFEFVFALNVLEHIKDDRAALCQLGRKLEKRGRLLVYVPAFQCLWTSLDEKLKHHRRYRRDDLVRLMQTARLSVLESGYVDPFGFFAALVFKILGRSADLTPQAVALYDRYIVPPSRALTPLFKRNFGKNVYVVASKD